MNLEMPMAALSTSAQFNTCHTYPSRSQREKYTDTYTHTPGPSGVFVFLFVSICSESGTWHLLGEQTSPMRPPGLSYVWMQTNTHHAKLIKSKGKYEPWTSQSNMHPCCLLYSHTKSEHATIWISVCSSHIPESFFFFLPLFSVRIEIRRTLNWTLSL